MDALDDAHRRLLIRSRQRDLRRITVEVRDSGPGIAATDLDRVFTAFYSTKSSGIGMGLSICRSIITAHGGKIWVKPNHNRGAAFRFTLPVYQVAAPVLAKLPIISD